MLINKVLCTRLWLAYNTSALDPFCPRYICKSWTGYFAIGKSTYSALSMNVLDTRYSAQTYERANVLGSTNLLTNRRFVLVRHEGARHSTRRCECANVRTCKSFLISALSEAYSLKKGEAELRSCRICACTCKAGIKGRPCVSKMYSLPTNRRTNTLICSAIQPLSIDRLKTMYLERRKKKLYYKPLLSRRLEASELFTWTYFLVFLIIPICALIAKASQHSLTDFITIATQPIALSAYSVTFSMAFLASLFNAFFGFILAWVLVRYNFTGKRLLDAAIDLPFAVPTSVAGLTLATVYSPNGWIGSLLQQFGIQVVYTRLGVATAMVFVSLPFVVRSLQPVLQEIDSQIEEAAWALGASPYTTFRRVLAPTLLPAFLTGITLGFSRAIGEYGSLVIVSANIPYKDLIASVLIFQNLEQYSLGQATVIATVVLFISFAILLGVSAIQSWNRNKLSSGQK